MNFRATVAFLMLVGLAVPLRAQLPPNVRLHTIESANFRVTYEPALEGLARHAAATAERARAALSVLVADPPKGTIDIVVTDNVDYTNGFARVFPSNRIMVFARPPVDIMELQYTRDWIELVVTHELAHIYHLDVPGVGGFVRSIFGRLPAPWPVFPALATPGWSIEGLATVIESSVTGFGRTHGSYHEMILRTAVLEGGFNDHDMLSSTSPVWPGGSRVYIYGSLFLDYLERRFGPEAIARLVSSIGTTWIPPFLWFDRVGNDAFGISLRAAYRDWQAELRERYARVEADITAQGLTASEPLTTHGAWALNPRFSPDGAAIAYTASDGRTTARLRVIDARTGDPIWSDRRNNTFSVATWTDAGRVIVSDLNYSAPFRVTSDLHAVTPDGGERLTQGTRYEQPDAGSASIVAVENGGGTNRLVLLDEAGRLTRVLNAFDPLVHWSAPRFSPRGDRIAVARWRAGGINDIVVIDTMGAILRELAQADGINIAPAWTPDERWIVFQSDRTGISNLFAVETGAATPRVRQVTNVLTGAFMPDVSPDGSTIVFAAAHRDGFRIERMPLDTATWRVPAQTRLANSHRDAYETTTSPQTLADSMNAAVAVADTTTGVAGPWRALRHLRPYFWVPVIESGATDDLYFGAWTSGEDLVGRHAWSILAAVDPSARRTRANADYAYRGLPSIGRAHPSLSAAVARSWDVVDPRDSIGDLYVEEREDVALVGLGISRPAWRSTVGMNVSGEVVRRSRFLYNVPSNLRLRDPTDDLLGVRASIFLANYSQPAFAISRQDGVLLQLAGLRRREREPRVEVIDNRNVVFDAGYNEVFTRNTAYRSIPTSGFARHVLAVRTAAIRRTGPGAGLSRLGGVSSTGVNIAGLASGLGATAQLLTVRGFHAGERFGNVGWAASAEYRIPVALVTTSLRPLPIYFDRLAASAFADAGHAWCDAQTAPRYSAKTCAFTSASATPLLSAGIEAVAYFSAFNFAIPLRTGVAFPLAGSTDRAPTVHLVLGLPF